MPRTPSPSERRRLLELAKRLARRSGATRYGSGGAMDTKRQLQVLASSLGMDSVARYANLGTGGGSGFITSLINKIFGVLTAKKGSVSAAEADLIRAIHVLREAGFDVSPGGGPMPPSQGKLSPTGRPAPPPTVHPQRTTLGVSREDEDEARGYDEQPEIGGFPTAPPRPGEDASRPREYLTPGSSNVYSYSWMPDSSRRRGTLYITFKAQTYNSDALSSSRSGGRAQLKGRLGSTTRKDRPNKPGATYAYWDLPTREWAAFHRSAQRSAGSAVWDYLRVRGSMWQHQYQYRLVRGTPVTQDLVSGGGEHPGGIYVPRKATGRGFRTRTLADLGRGRRGFVRSALPEQVGRKRMRITIR